MTATITLYCDHHDDTRRGCLAVYVADTSDLALASDRAGAHGWKLTGGGHDLCPKHAKEAA